MKFQIVVFDGFEELDVFGVFEPLRMADFDVKIVSLDEQDVVQGFYGAKIVPDKVLDLGNRPDVLLIPGGGWISRSEKGAYAEAERGKILPLLSSFHSVGTILATVCAGSLLLAKAGFLKGRPATTNAALINELRATGAKVIQTRVVDDGDIITASGITASLDLGIYLIERFAGTEQAIQVARRMEFESRGVVWRQFSDKPVSYSETTSPQLTRVDLETER